MPKNHLSITKWNDAMLNGIIKFFLENKLITFFLTVSIIVWGLATAPFNWQLGWIPRDPVPVDAIPDIGESANCVYRMDGTVAAGH